MMKHALRVVHSLLALGITVSFEGSSVFHAAPELTTSLIQLNCSRRDVTSVQDIVLDIGSIPSKSQVLNSLTRSCRYYNITQNELDALHGSFESVVKRIVDNAAGRLKIGDFYNAFDLSCLLRPLHKHQSSGYSHSEQDQEMLRNVLSSSTARLHLVSNAPASHVFNLLQCLGLAHIHWEGLLSPTVSNTSRCRFSFKLDDFGFFESLLREELGTIAIASRQVLVDADANFPGTDNAVNHRSLCRALKWISREFTFCESAYLEAKNMKDLESLSTEVREELLSQLEISSRRHNLSEICIVDLGAGSLFMLGFLLRGHGCSPAIDITGVSCVHYFAYEPNRNLESACVDRLHQLGFRLKGRYHWNMSGSALVELVFHRRIERVSWTVYIRFWGFDEYEARWQPPPNVIVGCCFADLMLPRSLAASTFRRFLMKRAAFSHTFMYFPITFGGTTQFLPPKPFEHRPGEAVPSDTNAFSIYAQCLELLFQHNLEPRLLVEAFRSYGADCLLSRSSDWLVHHQGDEYLWESLMYFFGTVAGPELQRQGWDAHLWVERARIAKPMIHVSNVDMLFRVPRLGEWKVDAFARVQEESSHLAASCQEMQFTAPGVVSVVTKPISKLQPNEVRVKSELSLISSGSELKFFRGTFDCAQLDASIKGMRNQQMSYPLAYGYSLVGRVVECGSHVTGDLLGRRVFCFSPHSDQAVVDSNDLQIVPRGIDAIDAIFLPSIETALSLVHDANPRFGERVVVFGQGIIGLLTTGILHLMSTEATPFGTLTTVDSIPSRLAASARFGSSEALLPSGIIEAEPFDVAIEVSGNEAALQQAIEVTREGGTVVVGSWYGSRSVSLKLGTDFHRSHIVIKASQVSEIPAELRFRWNKARRFTVAWDLVRALRPSRLITRFASLDQAQDAFEALNHGREIAVAFDYSR